MASLDVWNSDPIGASGEWRRRLPANPWIYPITEIKKTAEKFFLRKISRRMHYNFMWAPMEAEVVRVVVAEADPLLSELLVSSLSHASLDVRTAAGPPQHLLELCRQWSPCVLLMDQDRLEQIDGRWIVEQTEYGRAVQVLALGAAADPVAELRCLRLGCAGYLSRREGLATLRKAIHRVAAGELWAGRRAVAGLMREMLVERHAAPQLTGRERQILGLIQTGARNSDVAEQLFISPETVRWHVRRLFGKIGARSRAEAVEFARRHHIGPEGCGGRPVPLPVDISHHFARKVVVKNHIA